MNRLTRRGNYCGNRQNNLITLNVENRRENGYDKGDNRSDREVHDGGCLICLKGGEGEGG